MNWLSSRDHSNRRSRVSLPSDSRRVPSMASTSCGMVNRLMGAGIFHRASTAEPVSRPQPLPRNEPLNDYSLFDNIVDGVAAVLFDMNPRVKPAAVRPQPRKLKADR